MAFECFSSTFQGKFHFQGLFKTVLHIQVLFKPLGILGEENGILLSSGVKGLVILPNIYKKLIVSSDTGTIVKPV